MKLRVTLEGVDKAAAFLAAVKGQIPYATALALTRIAQAVKSSIESEMPRAFDSPTRWTLNSLRMQAARKNDLKAIVAVKDRAARGNPALFWLAPEVYGGGRQDKRAEFALKTAGLLPSGMQAVPGRAAKLNRFGNMTKGAIAKAVQGAQAAEAEQEQDGRTKYFVMRKQGKPIGIAGRFSKSRMGTVLAFVDPARYQPRLDFFGTANKAVAAVYRHEFERALKQAIETAK